MRQLRLITYRHRSTSTNWVFGLLLSFIAGAVNAGGFLVLHTYTSHMSGYASQLADSLVLGHGAMLLGALGAIVAFAAGAGTCAILVNWGRQNRRRAIYAPPLFLEGVLLFPFGLMGAVTTAWPTSWAAPMTVLYLSFIMGLQNAVGSKTSRGNIRTTHMTGNITDFGMEIGKLIYWNSRHLPADDAVRHDRERLRRSGSLVGMFLLGGMAGAWGFGTMGFICVVPLACVLLALSARPLLQDLDRMARVGRPWLSSSNP